MISRGFIALHRDIRDHWIFEDDAYFKAWVTILMEVNHKENTTLIKGKLLKCPRGQSLLSHESWAHKFGKKWNRQKVMRFFKLLESESMIEHRNEHVTTRISVCNYSQYQDLKKAERTPDDTPDEHQTNTRRTQPNHVNHVNHDLGGEKSPKSKRFVKPTPKRNPILL